MDMEEHWLHSLRSWAIAHDSIRELWLFGSRAQGCSRPDSDVDLALALVPPRGKNDDPALGNFIALADECWKPQLEQIVGRHVSLEAMMARAPGPDWDSMVRSFGVRLWSRIDPSFNPMPRLILKRASASRPSGQWSEDDYDVLEDGIVVGRIFLVPSGGPEDRPWMWASGHSADSIERAAHGHEPTREAAMAAFAKSWRRE
jgi:predicted nucleotidyltransferase